MTTLRRALIGAALVPLGFAGVVGVAYGCGVASRPTVEWTQWHEMPPTRAERLVERHNCWTRTAPAGVIPSRAVVTLPGERAKLASADIGFDLWLGPDGQPNTGDELAGTVHAFCE